MAMLYEFFARCVDHCLSLYLCLQGNVSYFWTSANLLQNIYLPKLFQQPYQINKRPDLNTNCLQNSSVDDKSYRLQTTR